jgi:DNA replication initiation complex subunit (GINS family)
MITFNDIYEAARKERYSEQLQKLNKNFILDVANYLKEKKEIASKEDDIFSDVIIKTKKQLENAVILFKELMLRRRKKILNLILIAAEIGISKQDFDNMIILEKELFEDLMKCIGVADKKLSKSLNGEKEEKVQKNELIVFKENVEEFVDLSGEKMGPFEKGQVANIPNEIAKILVDGNKAEIIEK